MLRGAILIVALCPLALVAQTSPDATRESRRVSELADRYLSAYVAAFPEEADRSGLPMARHDRLSDNSLAAVRAWQATEDSLSAALALVDARALKGRPAWITHGFLAEALAASVASRVCRSELWPVNQMSGWQASFAVLAEQQPVGTDANRADALARWGRLPHRLDTEVENLRAGVRLGYTTPKRLVELVIGQLDQVLAAAPRESPFYSPAERDSAPEFRAAWTQLLVDRLQPAVRRYRDYLRDEYLPAARTTLAVTANPNGLACYRASFRGYTSLDRSPEETSALGERTVARNESDVKRLGRRLFGTDDLAAIQARIRADTLNHFRDRDALLAFARDEVERARVATPQWFNPAPRTGVVVTPYPAFLEKTASSSYDPAAQDGSRPATFRIVLADPGAQLRSSIEVLVAHETYPGHHVQIALSQERPESHALTRLVGTGAFVEGWARYAEALAEEMGLYASDFTRIERRAWPAHGMVVDPGIHVLGWTREQAVQYVLATGRGTPRWAEALVDRTIAWPGQLTSYDTGGLEIFALREKAQRELGASFDIRRFHDAVLGRGAITLPMLRQVVDEWIAAEKR